MQQMTAASLYTPAPPSLPQQLTRDFPNFPLDKWNRKQTPAGLYSDNEAFWGIFYDIKVCCSLERKRVARIAEDE